MIARLRNGLVAVGAATVLAAAAGVFASPAHAYGKATWQAALTGTFVMPTTGNGFGFWGWCAFAGGVTSGPDADCQIAEYMHGPAGSGWTCELSIDGSWTQGPSVFDPSFITFHMTGSLVVHPGNLTIAQKRDCVDFFTLGVDGSTSFSDTDTFIPAAPGHYAIDPGVVWPGAVGEFNFTVARIGSS